MQFKANNIDVNLRIDFEENKNKKAIKNKNKNNWLIVSVVYKVENKIISKKSPVLQVYELIELRQWFDNIKNSEQLKPLDFLETSLNILYNDNILTVELCYELSLYGYDLDECTIFDLPLDKKCINSIIKELDETISLVKPWDK